MPRCLLLALALLLLPDVATAAPPVASFIYPAGGRRGTEVPIRVGGLFVHDECHFALVGPGVVASPVLKKTDRIWFEGPIIPLPDSQQPEDYPVDMLGSVTVDAKAPLGLRKGHLWTSQGVATGPVFVVGDLPEVVEAEVDGDPIPERIALPITANGRIFPREDSDLWEVKLKRGMTLSALVATAGINSPLRAKLEILDAEGRTLAEASPRPALGFDASARFKAATDGTYRVRISDVRSQGGPAFVYRLTLTTEPVADSIFPLGGQRGTKFEVNIGDRKVPAAIPADAKSWTLRFGAQSIPLDVDDLPEFTDTRAPINAPAILNGRVEKNSASIWKVALVKAKKYELELRAQKLGSPLCGTVVAIDPNGKEVARQTGTDPATDPLIALAPTLDGVYTIRVSERFRNRGGPEFAYRLRVREATAPGPDFRLTVTTDALNVPRAGSAKLKVAVERLGDFQDPIEIALAGLPAGVTAAKLVIAKGQSAGEVTLSAGALAKVAIGRATITGTAATRSRTAEETLLVAIAVPTPFAFTGEFTSSTAPRGQPYGRRYTLVRNGFDGPIAVSLADRQFRHLQGVTGPTIVVPTGKSEFEYAVRLPPWIEMGRTSRACAMAVGVVKDPDGTGHKVSFTSSEQNHQMIVVPEPGRLGIDLANSAIAVAPGGTVRVPVRISRAKSLTGAVKVELILPGHWRGVAVEPIEIPEGREGGELVLKVGTGSTPVFNGAVIVRASSGSVVAETKLELVKPD